MRYRQLGSSDLQVSTIGVGAITFGDPQRVADQVDSTRIISECLDLGINFIDTADAYGDGRSEVHVGAALKGRRDRALIATKFKLNDFHDGDPWPGSSVRQRITNSIDRSLRNLGTDHVDLYQVHHPVPDVPHEEVLGPLNELVEAGKVRAIGESNYSAWRHAQSDAVAARQGWAPFVSAQVYYNLLRRHVELEVLPFCTANSVGVLPYRPLASGWLSGRYVPGGEVRPGRHRRIEELSADERQWVLLDRLRDFAVERGRSVLDLAFAWLLAHPAVSSVIAGVSSIDQVRANAAADDWEMTSEERDAVDAITAWDGTGNEVEEPSGRSMKPRR